MILFSKDNLNLIENISIKRFSVTDYIVTGPQCNYPYVSTSTATARYASPTSLGQTENDDVQQMSTNANSSMVNGKKKDRNHGRNARTSIDKWMKRRRIGTETEITFVNSIEARTTDRKWSKTENVSVTVAENRRGISLTAGLARCKKCSIRLKPIACPKPNVYVDDKAEDISSDSLRANGSDYDNEDELLEPSLETKRVRVNLKKMIESGLNEDMTLKEIMEANEQMHAKKLFEINSKQKRLRDIASDEATITSSMTVQEKLLTSSTSLNDLISTESVLGNTEKLSQPKSHFGVSQSKPAISVTKKKAMNFKSTKKQSTTSLSNSRIRKCFISLKRLKDNDVKSSSNASKAPNLSSDERQNSIDRKDSISRLPTKSPQEYQFKRSFEKMPSYEMTSTLSKEVSCLAIFNILLDDIFYCRLLNQSRLSLVPLISTELHF